MVYYQLVDQEIFVNKNDQIEIIISAYMNKTRYKNVKKYIPKLIDCNVIRNRMITNKNGYSLLTNKKNYSVSEELLFNQIKKNVYNLNYMDEKKFLAITEKVYRNCKDFWDQELPDELSLNLILAGNDSPLSSIEVVSFLAELETELLDYSINISFLDKILEIDGEELKVSDLYEIINNS